MMFCKRRGDFANTVRYSLALLLLDKLLHQTTHTDQRLRYGWITTLPSALVPGI